MTIGLLREGASALARLVRREYDGLGGGFVIMGKILDKQPRTLPAKIYKTATRADGVVISAELVLVAPKQIAEPHYAVTITVRATRPPAEAEALVAEFMGETS